MIPIHTELCSCKVLPRERNNASVRQSVSVARDTRCSYVRRQHFYTPVNPKCQILLVALRINGVVNAYTDLMNTQHSRGNNDKRKREAET